MADLRREVGLPDELELVSVVPCDPREVPGGGADPFKGLSFGWGRSLDGESLLDGLVRHDSGGRARERYARVVQQFKTRQNPIVVVDGVFWDGMHRINVAYALGRNVLVANYVSRGGA